MNNKIILIIIQIVTAAIMISVFTWTRDMIEVALFFALWGFNLRPILK